MKEPIQTNKMWGIMALLILSLLWLIYILVSPFLWLYDKLNKKKNEKPYYPYFFVLLLLILSVTSCTFKEYIPYEVEVEKIINNTVYVNITQNATMCSNYTECVTCPNVTNTSEKYVLSLIQRLKWHDKQQYKYFNNTECLSQLNSTQTFLDRCEEEMCQYNISWC